MPMLIESQGQDPVYNEEEYVIPEMLGIVLRISQVILLAPVRLRRADRRWAIVKIYPGMVLLQRLLLIWCNSVVLWSLAVYFLVINPKRMDENTIILSSLVICCHQFLPMLSYSLAVLNLPGSLIRKVTFLQQIQKMKKSLKCATVTKNRRIRIWLSCLYILWQVLELITSCFNRAAMKYLDVLMLAGAATWYQNFTVSLVLMQWSLIIIEIHSTLSMLNDQLQSWLESTTITNISHVMQNKTNHKKLSNRVNISTSSHGLIIVHPRPNMDGLSDCYNEICDLIRKVDKDNGVFLLLSILLIFLRSIVTPYNFLLAFDSQNVSGMIRQTVLCAFHFCQLLTLVEPSHRLYQQQQRTRRILCKLVGETGRWDLNLANLQPFLLRMLMKDAVLEPMGMFHIARPLVASMFGGVATSLIILVQFR